MTLRHHSPTDLRILLELVPDHEESRRDSRRLEDVEDPCATWQRGPIVERQRDHPLLRLNPPNRFAKELPAPRPGEREGANKDFFATFSGPGYAVGVNVVVWALTH